MINDEAREYFKNKGLDYSILNSKNRQLLRDFVNLELAKFIMNGGEEILLRIRRELKEDIFKEDSEIKYFNISCKGSYFDKRQGITFEKDKFIGFAGWADSKNVQPFLSAFIKWCDAVCEVRP